MVDRPKTAELARKGIAASACLLGASLPLSIAASNISWGLMLASALLLLWSTGSLPWDARRSPVELPLYVFIAASVLASALGVDPRHSFGFLHQDLHKLWLYLLFMTALSARPVPKAAFWMGAGFCAAALMGTGQTLASAALHPGAGLARAKAFVHPVTFGEQMAVAVIGAGCFLLKPPSGQAAKRVRTAARILLGLCALALLLSNTRGAIAGCFAGAAAVLLVLPGARRWAPLALAAGVITIGAAELLRADRSIVLQSFRALCGGGLHENQFARLTLWDVALRMGADHLWTGVGHNNFRELFGSYFAGELDGSADWGSAHNLYLHHFAERGLAGVAALFWLLWRFWSRALQRVRERADAPNLWAFGTFTAFLVMNLTEVALQVEIVWMLVFFIWVWAETLHRSRSAA